jgi:WD40 repeat protein
MLALASACGGGAGPGPTPTPTAEVQAPTPEPTPTTVPTPTPEPAVEALAFISEGDIWLINAEGNGGRRLTSLGDVRSFSWVSSNELDVVTGEDRSGHLLIDLDGNVRELPFPAASSSDAGFTVVRARGSWSRDGSLYAVPLEQQLVIFDRIGAEVARLRAGPPIAPPVEQNLDVTKGECGFKDRGEPDRLIFGPPAFSPDGQSVLVAVNCVSRSGAYQLYSSVYEVSLDGSINRPLPQELSTNFRLSEEFLAPRFSPDGAYVAQMGMGGFSLCPVERELRVAKAEGSDPRILSPSALTELRQRQPHPDLFGGIIDYAWSPASDAIVASFDVSICEVTGLEPPGITGLYILKLDGSGEENLLDGAVSSVAWSPSGHFIAFLAGKYLGQAPEPPTISLLDFRTRGIRDLGSGHSPAWRPLPPDTVTVPWEGEVTDDLRIRSEANTASDTVGTLPKGAKVRVYGEAQGEEAEAGSGNRIWYRVIGGWVYSAFVER